MYEINSRNEGFNEIAALFKNRARYDNWDNSGIEGEQGVDDTTIELHTSGASNSVGYDNESNRNNREREQIIGEAKARLSILILKIFINL